MKKNMILVLIIIFMTSQISAFEFCQNGITGENKLRLISINDMLKDNPQEWKWQPLQKIELETRVENKNDESGTYILEAIFKDANKTIKIAKDSRDLKEEFSLSAYERKSISLEFEINEDEKINNYNLYIKFYKKNEENEECTENSIEKITIEKINLCKNKKVNESKLEITHIRDETKNGKDKWTWAPNNNIGISLNLENRNYSQRNFTTKLIFLNKNNEEISLANNPKDIIKKIELGNGKGNNINFYFKLKSSIKEGIYAIYAKTYDTNNKDICTSLKAEDKSNPTIIKIKKAERKVIITQVKGPRTTKTSSQEQYIATIANLGNKNENKVLAIVYNYRLGIKEKIEIPDLKSGEEENVTFNVSIPKNASNTRYSLSFSTEYEYNEKQDYFRSFSNKIDDISYYITINQGEIPEPKTQKLDEKIRESQDNKKENPTTIITGNAVGVPDKSPNWIILTILIILAIIGIILFFKKPKAIQETKIEPPQVIRRYKAKLSGSVR